MREIECGTAAAAASGQDLGDGVCQPLLCFRYALCGALVFALVIALEVAARMIPAVADMRDNLLLTGRLAMQSSILNGKFSLLLHFQTAA